MMCVQARVACRWPIAAALVLASCSGSGAGGVAGDQTTEVPTAEPTTNDLDAPIETSDPSVVSRRTAGIDVLVLPDGVELPEGYSQAAVPVDAFAAAEMVTQPADVTAPAFEPIQIPGLPFEATDGLIEVMLSIRSCRLVAVWALPHPDRIVVGYEEYPELTCVTPVEHVVTFEVPDAGKNSEGTWDYSIVPPVVPLRKVGPLD